ncbi:MAG: isopeptide-forming domain-containing fimbrial protein [Oliverpabstia sp.]|nr:isopeptide-forming domain-containing fimbrial protein [Lachnospiraceae bacterium]MDY5025579.1 isopeptide-forming domain-containing fimbrial protein [Oliverpabstia sp.]
MKRMKKLASLLLAMVMVLSMTITAFAEETTYSITIDNSAEGHTYEAYQIFTGDLSGTTLSNIVWGSGVSEAGQTALGDAAAKAEALKTEADAKAFAKAVAPYLTTAAGSASTVTDGKYVISGLAAGYYLVKDKDGSLTGDNDSYTEYIVKVVSNTTATPKSDVPTVQKKVKDINNSTDDAMTDWQDSADHDIGDSVPFQLKATLAKNVSSYTTYKVVFHDTQSKGLTYNNDAKVYIDGKETNGFTVTATVNADGTTTLTVSCDDVKALGAGNSSVITVEYTATLNGNAVLGSAGNPNEVYLEYSNNPNKSEEGNNETGNTPEDVVIVFTYKTIINKVTKNPDYNPEEEGSEEYIPLTGAEFTLEKYNKETDKWKSITVVKNDAGTTFTFSGLDDGNYRLTETKTPAGYNSIDPIEFTVTAEHDVLSDNPALTSLSGNATTGELTFTSNTTEGSLSADVVNKKGSTLPETGGMGTTIFYVIGAILVIGAGVVLITRKRMSASK